MKRPDDLHNKKFNKKELPIVDVVVDPLLSKQLRPHQVESVLSIIWQRRSVDDSTEVFDFYMK